MVNYDIVIEAVAKVETAAENGAWKIGDAVVEMTAGIEDEKLTSILAKCSEKLGKVRQEYGTKYSAQSLRKYREHALNFPTRASRMDMPMFIAGVAGNPENLERALTALRRSGAEPTQANIRFVMQEWRIQEKAHHKGEHKRAVEEVDRARAQQNFTTKKMTVAKTDKEREIARAQHQQAINDEADARRRAAYHREPPKGSPLSTEPPSKGKLARTADILEIIANSAMIVAKLQVNLKKIDALGIALDKDVREELQENTERAIEVAKQTLQRCKPALQRFRSVAGGAA